MPKRAKYFALLTNLLAKSVKFHWDDKYQKSFEIVKIILSCHPDVDLASSLYVDASDVAVGVVLSQKNLQNVDDPVAYFFKKLDKHQRRYSAIEKEAWALLLSLKHVYVYVGSSVHTIQVFTDHNPCVFVSKFHNTNSVTHWLVSLFTRVQTGNISYPW